jgi:hypothetical protein
MMPTQTRRPFVCVNTTLSYMFICLSFIASPTTHASQQKSDLILVQDEKKILKTVTLSHWPYFHPDADCLDGSKVAYDNATRHIQEKLLQSALGNDYEKFTCYKEELCQVIQPHVTKIIANLTRGTLGHRALIFSEMSNWFALQRVWLLNEQSIYNVIDNVLQQKTRATTANPLVSCGTSLSAAPALAIATAQVQPAHLTTQPLQNRCLRFLGIVLKSERTIPIVVIATAICYKLYMLLYNTNP